MDMMSLTELSCEEAKSFFLRSTSYFNNDLPEYISFEAILNDVSEVLNQSNYDLEENKAKDYFNVNYNFISNKDGRFAWRPLELMHPVIYTAIVNSICKSDHWNEIIGRFNNFKQGIVECCSIPVVSLSENSNRGESIVNWWQNVEQRSLMYSFDYNQLLQTDITNCYGSLYTHAIPWAIHGFDEAKKNKRANKLLGNIIDKYIRAGRSGQTNGISQGSVLMDFIAEIVLGYIDEQINIQYKNKHDFKVIRYRDDYRIFANSDSRLEEILKHISDELRKVGMQLGVTKTFLSKNVIEGSIKQDKLAGIELQSLGNTNAKTIQKQLLRLHAFGQKYPNSGALRRLLGEFHSKISNSKEKIKDIEDIEVQIAIATDIGYVSPSTFPAIAGILSHLLSLVPKKKKIQLWKKVQKKMSRIPYNGYLEIWMQRIVQAKKVGILFNSEEKLCKIVNGETLKLWESDWISNENLKSTLDVTKIVKNSIDIVDEIIMPDEIRLFKLNAWRS